MNQLILIGRHDLIVNKKKNLSAKGIFHSESKGKQKKWINPGTLQANQNNYGT